MIGLRQVAGGGADAAIGFCGQLLRGKAFISCITSQLAPYPLVQQLGHRLGKAVGQCLDQNRRIVIVGAIKTYGDGDLFRSGRDDKAGDLIRRPLGRDKIRQRDIGAAGAFRVLLAQGVEYGQRVLAIIAGKGANAITHGICGPEPHYGARTNRFFLIILTTISCASLKRLRATSHRFSILHDLGIDAF